MYYIHRTIDAGGNFHLLLTYLMFQDNFNCVQNYQLMCCLGCTALLQVHP